MSCVGRVLACVDGALCLFIFFPLAILHWRGTWGLQDVYFYPSDHTVSYWMSFVFGSVGCVALQLLQPCLFARIPASNVKTYWLCSRVFLYFNGWFVMGYWRGVWDLFDFYLTEHWYNSVILFGFCQLITALTRTVRNNVGLPFSVALDTEPGILNPDRIYSKDSDSRLLFVIDVLFCQFVVVTCNILVWRGVWNVYDAFLYPEDHLLSDVVSLVLGYVLCIVLFFLQWPAGLISTRLESLSSPVWKIVFEDVIMLVATWANLLVWRGAWDLCLVYVIPDPLVGGWVCHWVGTVGLVALQAFNSVATNGLEIDGSWSGGGGVFPTSYVRALLAMRDEAQREQLPSEVQRMIDHDSLDDDDDDYDLDKSGATSHLFDGHSLDDVTITPHVTENSNNNASSAVRGAKTKQTMNGQYSLLVNADDLAESSL